jgi:hypothetical protein
LVGVVSGDGRGGGWWRQIRRGEHQSGRAAGLLRIYLTATADADADAKATETETVVPRHPLPPPKQQQQQGLAGAAGRYRRSRTREIWTRARSKFRHTNTARLLPEY